MTDIERQGTTRRWSDHVTFNGLVFLCEVPASFDADIDTQSREVLGALAEGLVRAGSDRSRILNATIYLPQPDDLAAFNAVWDDWIPAGHAPVRACVHAKLVDPRMRVEIQLIAARR